MNFDTVLNLKLPKEESLGQTAISLPNQIVQEIHCNAENSLQSATLNISIKHSVEHKYTAHMPRVLFYSS